MIKNYVLLGAAGTLMFMASCKKDEVKEPENDLHKVHTCSFIDSSSTESFKTDASISKAGLWTPGQTIRIKFLSGTDYQKNKVKQYAPLWLNSAYLKFQWVTTAENADIKIDFDENDGSWSYLGTACRNFGQTTRTMNLGWVVSTETEASIKNVILHEFGHALGLKHEHLSPSSNISWDKEKVYAACALPPNSWDKATVDFNILNKETAATTNYTAFDNSSVMLYSFPSTWTTNGYSAPFNSELSAIDKKYIEINYPYPSGKWSNIFSRVSDVGVGKDGSVWVLSNIAEAGGYGIYKYNGYSFNKIAGGAVAIDVDPNGNPWVVNSAGSIFRGTPQGAWTLMPGSAKDISVGADGSVYMVGTDVYRGGNGIYKFDGAYWVRQTGVGVRISVDNQGSPWIINDMGTVWRLANGTWTNMAASATDIGCGADGSTFITTKTAVNGGYTIQKFRDNGWMKYSGGAYRVDVGPSGEAFVVNTSGYLYKYY
ncbi:MAG: M12 family metallopeptidase [Bacteroidetes bacterium]|nr:M12 family metallopeptidase [Bacteroidota bacterium]